MVFGVGVAIYVHGARLAKIAGRFGHVQRGVRRGVREVPERKRVRVRHGGGASVVHSLSAATHGAIRCSYACGVPARGTDGTLCRASA